MALKSSLPGRHIGHLELYVIIINKFPGVRILQKLDNHLGNCLLFSIRKKKKKTCGKIYASNVWKLTFRLKSVSLYFPHFESWEKE